jgi:UDP-3-O-[3-hydroxymyristoyl] glucosamine N-acyltransferase
MTDPRFFHRSGPFPLGEIARRIGAELQDSAAASVMIHDVSALETAGTGDLSVFSDARYRSAFVENHASAVLTRRDLVGGAPNGTSLVFAADPRLAFARAGHLFYPAPALDPSIDRSARVDPGATIGTGSQIDSGAVIGPGAATGQRCHISAHAVLGAGVVLGDDCRIGANTVISHALIGARVKIAPNATIGSEGFGFVPDPKGLLRMLQLGRVLIEDDVEIGANTTIDRGAINDTVIGAGTVVDNLVQIGHNVRIGRRCVLCSQVGIGGSTTVGDGVMIGGQAGIADHLRIGDRVRIAAASGIIRDIEDGQAVGGIPAMPLRQWHRQTAGLARLFAHGTDRSIAAPRRFPDRCEDESRETGLETE